MEIVITIVIVLGLSGLAFILANHTHDETKDLAYLLIEKDTFFYGDNITGRFVLNPKKNLRAGNIKLELIGRVHKQYNTSKSQSVIGSTDVKTQELFRKLLLELDYPDLAKGQKQYYKFSIATPELNDENKHIKYALSSTNGADSFVYWAIETSFTSNSKVDIYKSINLAECL